MHETAGPHYLRVIQDNAVNVYLNSSVVLSEKSSVKNSATLQFSVAPSWRWRSSELVTHGLVQVTVFGRIGYQLRLGQIKRRRDERSLLSNQIVPVDAFKEGVVLRAHHTQTRTKHGSQTTTALPDKLDNVASSYSQLRVPRLVLLSANTVLGILCATHITRTSSRF